MLLKPYQILFLSFIFMGTIVACSAESWFTAWLGLEINLMSLIPLLLIKLNPVSTESAIKYFLAQAMASILIMFASLSSNILFLNFNLLNSSTLIFLALVIKAGVAPLHFWFPQVMKKSDWIQCALIISWQKIAPFILISSFFSNTLFSTVALMSMVVGALGGLNQTNIKIILTYSSIIHSGWMLMTMAFSFSTWFIYYLIYVFISFSLISCFIYSNLNFTTQINLSDWNTTKKMNFSMILLSLGGLPPFLGFSAKISALTIMIFNLSIFTTFIMIMASLVSLFYYTQIIYNILMTSNSMNKFIFKPTSQLNSIFISISILGNMIIPMLVSLI